MSSDPSTAGPSVRPRFRGQHRGRSGSFERMGGRAILPLALALVMTAIAHFAALGNGFTNWDDPGYLIRNPLTVDPLADGVSGLITTRELAYPVPVTVLAYAGQRAAFGLWPEGFHLVSLALHVLCVALAMLLARRLGAGSWPAAGAALLFGVHPIVVEPVAWVVGQKDLLAANFLLLALLVRSGTRGRDAVPNALVFVLALLAIGAKPSAVAMVVILPAFDYLLGRRPDGRAVSLYAGLALAAIGSITLGLVGHGFVGGEAPRQFGIGSLAEALWAVSLHVRHLIWPDPLLARYFPPTGGELAAGAATGALLLAALGGAIVLAWRRGHREVAFSLAAALLAYAPVSGLVPLSRGPADSYVYLPLALAVIAGARGLGRLMERGRIASRGAALVAAAAVLGLSLASTNQTDRWAHAGTLWAPVAREYPDDPRALMRVADAYLHIGDLDAALAHYEGVHLRYPDFVTSLPGHAATLQELGRDQEAERLLARAVRVDGSNDSREVYGFFLATHSIRASDDAAARASLITVGRLLAARGKRATTVARAAELLRVYGEVKLAAELDRRLAELKRR